MVNALRGHLAEHGIIMGKGLGNVERLATLITSDDLPELVRTMGRKRLIRLIVVSRREANQSDIVRRLGSRDGDAGGS